MKNKICQSCSMPLKDHNRGTERDGSRSPKYCSLCYESGAFKNPQMTVEQMQSLVMNKMKGMYFPGFIAKLFARKIPKLERWRIG